MLKYIHFNTLVPAVGVQVPRCWRCGLPAASEEKAGLPRAKSGRFHPAPAALPQGAAEPRTQGGGVVGKTSPGKGKTGQNAAQQWGSEDGQA